MKTHQWLSSKAAWDKKTTFPVPYLDKVRLLPSTSYYRLHSIDERSDCSWLAADETTRGMAANEESRRMAAIQA
jgi:hypothetical protein